MGYNENDLLENHLAFLATHRGQVRKANGLIAIEGEKPEFTYAILGAEAKLNDVAPGMNKVQLLPSSSISAESLSTIRFAKVFGLSYMVLDTFPEWRKLSGFSVTEVCGRQDSMDIFSEVQARGFNESEGEYQAWHPFLKAANDRNLKNPRQHFYIGFLNGEALGTVLALENHYMLGIYAVATLAQHRKRGVSAAIMERAIRDALEKGIQAITLQVVQDSYVEDFYRNLGFKRIFVSGVYRRNS